MFTPEEYQGAWMMYLGGVALMFACWFYLTHFLPWKEVRQLARIFVVVLFLTPWYTDVGSDYFAPAIVVSIVEALTQGIDAFWRAGTPLVIALILSITFSLAWNVWCWHRAKSAVSAES